MTFALSGLFAAGLLTFLSPCVLPLVPIYLALLGGASVAELRRGGGGGRLLGTATAFSLGLSAVFVALGMAATSVGHALVEHRTLLMQLSRTAMVVMGLKFLGVVTVPALDLERRPLLERMSGGGGLASALLLGGAFALGWTPCIGPVLGSVLTYTATTTSSLTRGGLYLASYAAGLVVPLLLVALVAPLGLRALERARSRLRWFELATGAIMLASGLLLVTDHLGKLGQWEVPAASAQAADRVEEPAAPVDPPCGAEAEGATSCEVRSTGPEDGQEGEGLAPDRGPMMIEFMSPSCAICRRMIPAVAAAGRTCAGQGITARTIDVSRKDSARLVARYQIRGIPTFLFLDGDGREVARLVGEQSLGTLEQSLAVLSGRRCEGFREIRAAPHAPGG